MNTISLQESLLKIGVSKVATKCYCLLVSDPKISITEICSKTGQYRLKIYQALEELAEMELIERKKDYSRNISIKSPSAVFSLLKQKQYEINRNVTKLKEDLPFILANYFDTSGNSSVKAFDGENKFIYLLTTLFDNCPNATEMISFNEGDEFYKLVDTDYFFNVWVENRVKRGIFNSILDNHSNTFYDKEKAKDKIKLREVRVLPKQLSTSSCYWVIENKVIFWDTLSVKAVLIENASIANLLKANFELVWEGAG